MTAHDLVRDLGEVGAADRAAAGGKGASLGELLRAGIPVPPGFVITVTAFERALASVDPSGEIHRDIEALDAADSGAIARCAAQVRTRIAGAPLPAGIEDEVTTRYRALGGGGGGRADDGGVPVAVRSSATGEDSAEASFAGLQDTYLWVCGAGAVVDHVRRCWASLYNAEAVAYRLRMNWAEHDVAMAVVVQRMVEPRCAGVMFTRSPVTGDRSVIAVEGSWGLGSALVSGEVTPDSFVISKVTGEIVRRTVSAKHRLHRRDPGGSGVTADDVPKPMRDRPCLDDAEIAVLASLGRRVEDHYGAPQDIEWAITADAGNGEGIMLLQSRPETAWARRAAAPVARPRPRAIDHVFEQLGRVNRVRPER